MILPYKLLDKPFRGALPNFETTGKCEDPNVAYCAALAWCATYRTRSTNGNMANVLGVHEIEKDQYVGVINYRPDSRRRDHLFVVR